MKLLATTATILCLLAATTTALSATPQGNQILQTTKYVCSGSYSTCCTNYTCSEKTSSSRLTRHATAVPFPVYLQSNADCTTPQCACYTTDTRTQSVDITEAVQSFKRTKRSHFVLACTTGSGATVSNLTISQVATQMGTDGGYYPYPFSGNCSSSSAKTKCNGQTPVTSWPMLNALTYGTKVNVPLSDLQNIDNGVVLAVEAEFVGTKQCSFGSTFGDVTCSVDIVGA